MPNYVNEICNCKIVIVRNYISLRKWFSVLGQEFCKMTTETNLISTFILVKNECYSSSIVE